MSGHWPAPWTWDGTFPIRVLDAEQHIVCEGIMPSGIANVHLILAAPKLLACAKRMAFAAAEDAPELWAEALLSLEVTIAEAEPRGGK